MPASPNSPTPKSSLTEEQLARLKAEYQAPLRGVRQFFYFAFAGSALLGAVIFIFQLFAGADVQTTLFNLAVQFSVFGLMIGLWRLDRNRDRKSSES